MTHDPERDVMAVRAKGVGGVFQPVVDAAASAEKEKLQGWPATQAAPSA
jgi:hypothetical protein